MTNKEKNMKVKVVKCSNSTYWYSEHVGEEFEVKEAVPHPMNGYSVYYLADDPSWFIRVIDSEIIKTKPILPIPESTLEWLQSRQKELQDYVIQCMEYGDEIRKDITQEYCRNQQRILEIEKC